MKKSKEYKPSNRTAVLIVGDPGTRKTSLALHFPKPYVFDADSNLAGPARKFGETIDFLYDNGHVASAEIKLGPNIVYKEGETILPAHRYLWMAYCLTEAAKCEEVRTIIVDGLTSITDFVLSEVKRQEIRKDDDAMRIQDWGKFAYIMKNLVTQLKTSGKVLVFTGHNNVDKDEADGIYKTFLAVPGQSKTTLAGLFNDVWCTYLTQSGPPNAPMYEYKVRTMPRGQNDHRGLKSSLPNMEKPISWEEACKIAAAV